MSDCEYVNMLQEQNIQKLTTNLIKLIQSHFNSQAPRIKVKSNVKNNNKCNAKLSNETKELIKKKNISYKEMKELPSDENKKISKCYLCYLGKPLLKTKILKIENILILILKIPKHYGN